MSQELQVVQCYSCHTYQTQIVKKAKKWICKICNEKQSLKKVFGQGAGKDCRMHCQKLNGLRAQKNEEIRDSTYKLLENDSSEPVPLEFPENRNMSSQPRSSKWDKYLSQPSVSDDEEGDDSKEIPASQFFMPKCTPESFEIPCTKKYKSVEGEPIASAFFMDSDEDDCFNIDIPTEKRYEAETDDVNVKNSFSGSLRKTTVRVSSKKDSSVNSISKGNFNLIADDFMEEDMQLDTVFQNNDNLPEVGSESSKIVNYVKGTPMKTTESVVPTSLNVKANSPAVFKMVPSSNIVVEQLKRRVSLLEDIDTYTLDNLTEMCKF